jgi:hypothetical protein
MQISGFRPLAVAAFLALMSPAVAWGTCETVPSAVAGTEQIRCESGVEFKIVAARVDEPAVAKMKLPGPFGTMEFTAAYVRPGELVRLVGVQKGARGPATPKLYAFLKGNTVRWITLVQTTEGGATRTEIRHNLTGVTRVERIQGALDLPAPTNLRLIEHRVEAPLPEAVYTRLGL